MLYFTLYNETLSCVCCLSCIWVLHHNHWFLVIFALVYMISDPSDSQRHQSMLLERFYSEIKRHLSKKCIVC